VTVDAAGFVYVADAGSHAIRRISPAGTTTTLAGLADHPGSDDGTGNAARFSFPVALAVDGQGNVFVAEQDNHTVRRITPAGVVTTVAGKAGEPGRVDGAAAASRFFRPNALAFDADGNLFISDEANSVLRRLAPDGVVSTVAGRVASRAVVTGADGRLNEPQALAVLPGHPRRLAVVDEHAVLTVTLP
jgi:sugar lactone lactonase YvrE